MWAHNSRSTNWSRDISKEKMPVPTLLRWAALLAMFNASEVLPTPGRAARMIRSDFCKPPVSASKRVNPVGTPIGCPRRWWISSSWVK